MTRLGIGLLGWALVSLDLTTNVLRDTVGRLNHPIGPAVIPLALLLVSTILLWVRGPTKTLLDFCIAALAPPLILFWHVPQALYRQDNPGLLLAYASLVVDFVAHSRTIFTFLVLFVAGATTMAARQPWLGLVGAVLLASGLMFGAVRLAMRMLDPNRMLGIHARQIDRVLNQNPLEDIFDKSGSKSVSSDIDTSQLIMAAAGVGLGCIASDMLRTLNRGHHISLIVGHLVLIYFSLVAAIAALHVGVYDTWPTAYSLVGDAGYFRFFAHTMLSTFNIPGSGIEPSSIGAGLLHWVAVVLLGFSGLAAVYGTVQSVRGKYVEVVMNRSRDLTRAFSKFNKRFKQRYKKPIVQVVYEVREATELRGFSGFLASIIRFLADSEVIETEPFTPSRQERRRNQRGR